MIVGYLCEYKIVLEHSQEDDLSAEDDPRLEDDNELECTCTCNSLHNLILK